MISVLLADDHAMLRDGLRFLLEASGDIQVVDNATNGLEAVEKARLHCPDVAVIDISMPIMDGIEATRQICTLCPHTHILILTMHHSEPYLQRSLQAGALGFLLKDAAGKELVAAVRAVSQGKSYVTRSD